MLHGDRLGRGLLRIQTLCTVRSDMAMNKAGRVFLKAHGAGLDLPLFTQEQRSVTQSFGVLLRAAFDPPKRRTRTILDDVTFDLAAGDRLAIVGRNGSGKSTLLKVLVGAYQ